MNKILTAIGNPEIAEKLGKENSIEIIYKDIQYKEGILEILEKDNKINTIIINEKIPGKIEINLLIENILRTNSKIKIYLIIENKNIKIKNNNLYIFNEINYEKIKQKLFEEIQKEKTEEKKPLEIKPENEESKSEQEKLQIQNENIEERFISDKHTENFYENLSKFVIILGNENIGKSTISMIIASLISRQKKVLLVDMDIENGNINTIFQVKKNTNKIQKIAKNLDFICTKDSIEEIQKNYDFIFIDNYNKKTINKNYKIIFISEGNLIGIEKSKKILYKLKILENKNKILIINYYNRNSIDIKILKNIFCEFKNIEKIKYSEKYNLIINNFKKINLNIFLNKEYKNIIQKIIN